MSVDPTELPKIVQNAFWKALDDRADTFDLWWNREWGEVDGPLPECVWETIAEEVMAWLYKDFPQRAIMGTDEQVSDT